MFQRPPPPTPTPQTPTKTRLPRGIHTDGEWKCNCTPRLSAAFHTVKKSNHNHGRRFYTCSQPLPKSCDFFLWESEAVVRESTPTPSKNLPTLSHLPTPSISPTKRQYSPPPSSPAVPHTPKKTPRANLAQRSPTKRLASGEGEDLFTTPGRSGSLFPSSGGGDTPSLLITQVLPLLTEAQRKEGKIEEVLGRHVRIAEGVVRGRRVARDSLLQTKARVGELERRVERVEMERGRAEREVEVLRGELEAMKELTARMGAAALETQGWDLMEEEVDTQSTCTLSQGRG